MSFEQHLPGTSYYELQIEKNSSDEIHLLSKVFT